MKTVLFLCSIVFCVAFQAQENQLIFEFNDGIKPYGIDYCINSSKDDSKLNLSLIKGELETIKSFNAVIKTDTNSFEFTNYREFVNTDLINMLKVNEVFENSNTITVQLNWVLTSEKTERQEIIVCLENAITDKVALLANENKEFIEIPISFVTDRNDTKNKDFYERFGGKRSEIQYGRMVVTIPYAHTLGEIERPSYWRLEFSEDKSKHVTIQSIEKQNKDTFFEKMKSRIASNGGNTFLFVHGYNVSFADAAMRTAQITFDLRFNGEPVFYSWPSQASTSKYTVDEANIEWTRYNLKQFLKEYLTKTEAKNIYLVAHSMGNRGLTKALIELMTENPELKEKVTEVILAAPDIDADVFKRDLAPQMVKKIGKPITLYVSSDDLALLASQKVHGNNRAGLAGDNIVLVKGVETIDASGIDTSFLSHSYFATSSNLIKDIFNLMKSGKRATDRETLEKVSKDNLTYWKVKKGQNK